METTGTPGVLVNTFEDVPNSAVPCEPIDSGARVLTPPGAGAVAVIAATVPQERDPADVFRRFRPVPDRNLQVVPPNRIVFGAWGGEDVVMVRIAALHWEIHCHGGLIAVRRILDDLAAAGIPSTTRRIDEHRPEESIADAARQLLLQCRTRKTASLVLSHLDGRLERLLSDSRSAAPDVRAAAIEQTIRWCDVAAHVVRPWRVAMVGAPNAGKSSLLNAIAGLQRSIVSSVPGTTRDLVEVDVVIDGWMFQLIDTAGVRSDAQSEIEEKGIENALEVAENCDLLCVVVDVSHTAPERRRREAQILERLARRNSRVCIVENKIDLLSPAGPAPSNEQDELCEGQTLWSGVARLPVSAVTSEGLPKLLQWLLKSAVPEEPTLETTLPLTHYFETHSI